jgi:hypothetical protein
MIQLGSFVECNVRDHECLCKKKDPCIFCVIPAPNNRYSNKEMLGFLSLNNFNNCGCWKDSTYATSFSSLSLKEIDP